HCKEATFPKRPIGSLVHAVLARVSPRCPPQRDRLLTCYSPVRHSTQSRRIGLVRLACVRHAASVRPEPGSNSPIDCLNSSFYALQITKPPTGHSPVGSLLMSARQTRTFALRDHLAF